MPDMRAPVVLIANPTAYKASLKKIEQAAAFLRTRGLDVALYLTERKGDAEEFARAASGRGNVSVSFLIAAGGDGTVNEVVNGAAGTGVPVAVLPLGVTNVLAKELGIPEQLEGALEIAVNGKPRSVSLGRISLDDGKSRYFCLMAGIGFDALAVRGLNPRLKRISGIGAHLISGAKALIGWRPERLTFTVDGRRFEGYSAVVAKAKKYGGDFLIAPDADIREPALYLTIMHGRRRLDILRYATGILRGRHLRLGDITHIKAEAVRVEGRAPVQLDGDHEGSTPASITVVPDAAKLVY